MATNKDTQMTLDTKKWNESFKENRDLSGEMEYCLYCPQMKVIGDNYSCKISHEERFEKSVCAKAYNKMKKEEKKRYNIKRG